MTPPKAHHGLTYEEYCALQGVRASNLAAILDCPARCYAQIVSPSEQTKDQALGTALHSIILDRKPVLAGPAGDKRTKALRAAWAGARDEAEATGAVLLEKHQVDMVQGITESLRRHPVAAAILMDGPKELSLTWDDDGRPRKARIDAVGKWAGWTIVADLKSAKSANPRWFGYDAERYGYDIAAAHYLAGCAAVFGERRRRFVFIVAEKVPPYIVSCVELDDDAMDSAQAKRLVAMDEYRRCEESGIWPAYGSGIHKASNPRRR